MSVGSADRFTTPFCSSSPIVTAMSRRSRPTDRPSDAWLDGPASASAANKRYSKPRASTSTNVCVSNRCDRTAAWLKSHDGSRVPAGQGLRRHVDRFSSTGSQTALLVLVHPTMIALRWFYHHHAPGGFVSHPQPLPPMIGRTENTLRALLNRALEASMISGYEAWVVLNRAAQRSLPPLRRSPATLPATWAAQVTPPTEPSEN